MAAQLSALRKEADWQVAATIRDPGESGKDLLRPGLRKALELLANREPTGWRSRSSTGSPGT